MVLAAGLSSRYGAVKQLESIGPAGELLMDYSIHDARRAGFERVVFVIRPELEEAFRHQVRRISPEIAAAYVFQHLDDLPERRLVPPGRTKPWGTGHAVLAAAPKIDGAFAVINADDYYGPASYRLLHDHFRSDAVNEQAMFALVGYPLAGTVTQHGGVSRAVCRCDTDGFLTDLVELTDVRMRERQITGRDPHGTPVPLKGDEIVSMNCWGFTAAVLPLLQAQFAAFLEREPHLETAEFLIPLAVNDILRQGQGRCKVLSARESWFGMTHRADRALVQQHIRNLVDRDQYPSPLFSG
ncbi:MAG: NTP transferase domain-containing protein [Gemmatimonadetes bacterium]|nr:NTP transferase domain-containing protein [Gemmatimonadota bacterium]